MKTRRGTPKTLKEAITNGLELGAHLSNDQAIAEVIRLHVNDFISQKTSVSMIQAKTPTEQKLISDLWSLITKE